MGVKPVPVRVTVVSGEPTIADDGEREVNTGGGGNGAVIVKGLGADFPPSGAGFVTTMSTVRTVARSEAVRLMVSCVGPCNFVGRGLPPNEAIEDEMKFVPATTTSVAAEPAGIELGVRAVMFGAPLSTLKVDPEPPLEPPDF